MTPPIYVGLAQHQNTGQWHALSHSGSKIKISFPEVTLYSWFLDHYKIRWRLLPLCPHLRFLKNYHHETTRNYIIYIYIYMQSYKTSQVGGRASQVGGVA